jgi:ABC-type branched-subunit amino acid transport system substrate-binding protein
MRRARFFFVILLIAGTVSSLLADEAADVFARANRYYQAGRYDSTIVVIRDFLMMHSTDPGVEYLVPLAMEAFARTGDYAPMASLYELYRDKFSSSTFMPRVAYYYGYALSKQRFVIPALDAWTLAMESGASQEMDSLIIADIAGIKRTEPDLTIAPDTLARFDPRIRAALAGIPAPGEGKAVAAPVTTVAPATAPVPQPDPSPSPAIKADDNGEIPVGLLVPLTGDNADVGNRIRNGAELAIEQHNAFVRRQIVLHTGDTKGSLIETARRTSELLAHRGMPAIIGPVLSPAATVTAAMLIGKPTVMLTPTATDDGIASLGPNIFQMNITLGVLARSVARYALENLNIHEFIIIAPHTAVGSALSAAFGDEVTKKGGTVVVEESYEEGANDYTALFAALRKKLLIRALDLRAKERGGAYRPVRTLTWGDSSRMADSAVSAGAIFLPSDAEDLAALTSQIAFNRIHGQLLGSSGWRSPKTTLDNNQYLRDAIISAPFEPDASWRAWPGFASAYAAKFREEPDRVAALGYDAAALIAAAIDSAGAPPDHARLQAVLSKLSRFEGASGVISFDPQERTNTEAAILKLTPSGFIRVQ